VHVLLRRILPADREFWVVLSTSPEETDLREDLSYITEGMIRPLINICARLRRQVRFAVISGSTNYILTALEEMEFSGRPDESIVRAQVGDYGVVRALEPNHTSLGEKIAEEVGKVREWARVAEGLWEGDGHVYIFVEESGQV